MTALIALGTICDRLNALIEDGHADELQQMLNMRYSATDEFAEHRFVVTNSNSNTVSFLGFLNGVCQISQHDGHYRRIAACCDVEGNLSRFCVVSVEKNLPSKA